ncbi:hypothetical protein ASPZODRAFT_134538 [Penicilliopsis zonata CBS 506.65]|uniref:FAD/NAD(P)-binding domain-containing protein n=1 Tax=Penicilliopsis zonata CBS 506.65 TaxID=1073090 RepID=A0A1L9SDE4_9EURO|nr:hypothetical protein ASPZODRAFT_134538 [Penicilliopsis zonata CBS 506.65]OJJ45114.1 hypothetical protein ASPZODRAFT_134538 [Penicilliopsis zonata CBS 506.65]
MNSLDSLPGTLPRAVIPDNLDLAASVSAVLTNFPALTAAQFTPDAIWRDSFALTGTFRTIAGVEKILTAWNATSSAHSPRDFVLIPPSLHVARHDEYAWIDARFQFTTHGALCSGGLSLVPAADGSLKIWVLTTILENLTGAGSGNVDVLAAGVPAPISSSPDTFDVVVVGGGQSGLAVGGRLHALGISYVVIDKYLEVGDSWKTRYDSTKLHTLRDYSHLPFEKTFDASYPQWLTKDDLARGFKAWTDKFNINVWTRSPLKSCTWNDNLWTLNIERHGEPRSLTAKHVVFAIGTCQIPYMPDYADKHLFNGTILHSAEYKSPAAWKGKKGVVIGTANTGHDVAVDMVNAGLESVTMVQRSQTWVLPQENYARLNEPLYNAHMPTELADRLFFSLPLGVTRQLLLYFLNILTDTQRERFDALEARGFKLQRYGDLIYALYERFGGHYMDVGSSELIIQGRITMQPCLPTAFTPDGLLLQDGSILPADLVVFATGFHGNLRTAVGTFVGQDIHAQLSDFLGVDDEGELRGAWKFTGHPKLWYSGYDLGSARYFSRFIALQIKADLLGRPLDRYEIRL